MAGSLPRVTRSPLHLNRKAVLAAAVIGALGAPALAQVYWDVNGTGAGSGITTSATLDWFNDNFGSGDAVGSWDGVTNNWNSNSTGGAGTLSANPGAGVSGVFSAGDPNLTYIVSIPGGAAAGDGGVTVTAGGFTVNAGTAIIAGEGNGGLSHSGVGGVHGNSPSFVDTGSGAFNVNVATGASLLFGYRFRLPTWKGSGTITKTGGGMFNMFPDQLGTNNVVTSQTLGKFTGKYDLQAGTLGLAYGGNQTFENPAAFTADKLKIDNNAQVRFFQNTSTRTIPTNFGITIGAGGAQFYSAGSAELDGITSANSLAAILFTGRLTGGSSGSPVTITLNSNTFGDNNTAAGDGTILGGLFTFNVDSSSSLFAKWVVKKGVINTGTIGTDVFLGAAPSYPTADSITLDGGGLRTAITTSISANRGITLTANGGSIRPQPNTFPGPITFTINSPIVGVGALTVYVDRSSGNTVLTGANTYSGGTFVKGLNSRAAVGGLQGTTTSLQGPITLGDGAKLIFDQTTNGSYTGNISGSGSLSKGNTGAVLLTGTNTYDSTTTVNGGTLALGSNSALPSGSAVTINSTGTLQLASSGNGDQHANSSTIKFTSLTVNAGGNLDLTNNLAVIPGAMTQATVRSLIIAARNTPVGGVADGTWDGKGIGSSTAAAHFISDGGQETRVVGYAVNGDLPLGAYSTFGGQTVGASDILVRYTTNGDADLDGKCGDNDVTVVGGFYDNGVTTTFNWLNGDFNYDGKVDDTDVTILGGFYNEAGGFLSAASLTAKYGAEFAAAFEAGQAMAVPEPTSLTLLGLGAVGILRRRRRIH